MATAVFTACSVSFDSFVCGLLLSKPFHRRGSYVHLAMHLVVLRAAMFAKATASTWKKKVLPGNVQVSTLSFSDGTLLHRIGLLKDRVWLY